MRRPIPSAYALFQGFNMSIVGRIILGGWLFCAFYHLCNGIRHLFWDAGYGFELKNAYRSGWIVVARFADRHGGVVDRRPRADLGATHMSDPERLSPAPAASARPRTASTTGGRSGSPPWR